MRSASNICPKHFVEVVSPILERRDVHGLVASIKRNWTIADVASLLDNPSCDARKVAALALSLIGTSCCLKSLARQLHDPDPVVSQMAEHAMWSIWLRAGNERANGHVARGTQLLARKDLDGAAEQFTLAIQEDPTFAEAHNQRAMVYYLQEKFERSLADCRKTTELQPLHFGAWAGMGHCHACLGQVREAVECYRQAKLINPHLDCVDDLIHQLDCECDGCEEDDD
ncbi:MAG: tetratricopeptide repeat protein [Tepidisphaeraceae bacterium]